MVVYHVASGQAFFSGAASILAAVALASFLRDGWLHRRRHVLLVLGVMRRDGATLDSVHLSQAGHERMAEVVWDVVRPAFE